MSSCSEPQSKGTVLITGAASGIGKATAELFAQRGWCCVLLDRDLERLWQLKSQLVSSNHQKHLCRVLDLTDPAAIQSLGQDLPELDALINNAGMSDSGASALEPVDEEVPARLMALNLAAPAHMVQACTHRLRTGARIVNVASGAGLRAIPHRGLYSPSKAGLLAQTRALAQARPAWTVTSLAPGFVRTDLVQQLIDSGRLNPAEALFKVPLGRMAEPWEMAQALYFLAAQAPAPMSGQTLAVCGGSSVYGGSQKLPQAEYDTLAPDSPLLITILGPLPATWSSTTHKGEAFTADASAPGYNGYVDGSACLVPDDQVLRAVQTAASHFLERLTIGPASLTLLLPSHQVPWEHAGDRAAARMLVSTLAAEWGTKGLRINAIEGVGHVSPDHGWQLLRYMAGAGAQYLTGQTLCLNQNASGGFA
jgi:NAD(P)-dependent dehydrogenase (short-subunit alcohol dehydrogenase family)